MKKVRQKIIQEINDVKELVKNKKVTVGLDAFIDKIVQPVEMKDSEGNIDFFDYISSFGNHIVSKSGKSCGIELRESFTKLGGNGPIMAHAFGKLGVATDCIGNLGYPDVDPVFNKISSNCKLHTIGTPCLTTALEFTDGKIMFSQREFFDKMDWDWIKSKLSIEDLKNYFLNTDLVCLINWTCIIYLNNIFRGILDDIFCGTAKNKSRIYFFDLADFSNRSYSDIVEVIKLINEFNDYNRVVLSLNENEAMLMYEALFKASPSSPIKEIGELIYKELKIDSLVIHTLNNALAWDEKSFSESPSLFIKKPKLSTGGGDNFNTGLCFGLLMGLDLASAAYFGNATSGYYVRNAESPTIAEVLTTLKDWDNLIETP